MKSKKLFLTLIAGFLGLGVTACGGDKKPDVKDEITGVSLNETAHSFALEGDVFELTATLTFTGNPDKTITWSTSDDKVASVEANGDKCVVTAEASEGTCVITAKAGEKSAGCNISFIPKAAGLYDYSHNGYNTKAEITGALEKWAVEKKLTGITLYEDGGYVMYSPDVEKGAPSYIKGYGFGTLAEGRITKDLAGETEDKYKRYYHTYESSDPAKILYMDDDGGVVSGYVGYASGGYFDIAMNETRTGYNWVGDLATVDRPIAINPDASGASKVFAIPVKTGSALKYSTLTANQNLAQFNNREVQLEDYITPYKVYYTQAYGMRRNGEIKDSNSGSIYYGEAYKNASKSAFVQTEWDKVGIKAKNNATYGDYVEFTFNKAYTPFWAMYYLSSSMFAPVPEAFISALGGGSFDDGVQLWGKFNNDTTLSPVDTFLSTGPYTLETWNKDQLLTFKRNPNYVKGDVKTGRPSTYNIEGVYLDVITALSTDKEAAFKKFLNDQLHAVTIPSTQLKDYAQDPRTTIVPGSSTTKLNLNTCTSDQWADLFGKNGTIVQTPEANYWNVKPCMSNSSFVDGLSYCIDRKTFAANIGATPSNDYFGSGYYANPEEGIFYNDTQQHKDAVAKSLEGTDGYGYSLEKAKVAFKAACEELIAEGAYKVGDKIQLEMAWMVAAQEDTYAKPLAKMIENAFNDCGGGLTLQISHYYGAVYTDVYYKKMMVGQFDIGYGGIEGNSYDPLNFLEVLKSDNSSTFTLNWGIATNEFVEIEYDGKLWTYDALWEAGDHGGYVNNGINCPVFGCSLNSIGYDKTTGDLVLGMDVIETKILKQGVTEPSSLSDFDCYTKVYGLALYGYTTADYSDYAELYFWNGDNHVYYGDGETPIDGEEYWCSFAYDEADPSKLTLTISAATMALWLTEYFPDQSALRGQGFDVYKLSTFLGSTPTVAFYSTIFSGYLA